MTATDLTMPVLGGTRILVVDANEDAAATLTAVLRLNGFEARAAQSVVDTVQSVQRHPPRAVILDTDLPDADWRKLVRRLQGLVNPLALIVLTGDTSPTVKRAAFEAGASAHLLKPAEPSELVRLLQHLCDNQAA
jgi:DNA-binding response OmpR family regulator